MISNNNQHLLIDRVCSISQDLFSGFSDNDVHYAQREYSSYLGFALSSVKNSVVGSSPYGTAIEGLSLVGQWEKLRQADIGVEIPNYILKHEDTTYTDMETNGYTIDNGEWPAQPSSYPHMMDRKKIMEF